MKLNNKVYDVFKWLLFIFIPASITLLTALTQVWGWDIPIEGIVTTISAVSTFIGVILGISTIAYNQNKEEIENDY